MIESLLRKIKIRFQIWRKYWRTKNTLSKRNVNQDKSVYFDLFDIRQEPYYFPIIFSFHELDYSIIIADNKRFIGHSFGPAEFIFCLPNVVISNKSIPAGSLIITDSIKIFRTTKNYDKKILLRADAFNAPKNSLFLPYPMHPNIYYKRQFEEIKQKQLKKRQTRVLFSGNTDPLAYSRSIIQEKFHKVNRAEIIKSLLEHLSVDHLITIQSAADKAKLPHQYYKGVVLYLWQWSANSSNGLEIRVPNNEWLDFLASGDFFLCCPGVVIPQSHNAIEAMSVGTIPILQYSELFHPNLVDGDNCIYFSDCDDLLAKIKIILEMDFESIMQMRRRVVKYYNDNLRHDMAARMILNLSIGSHEVYFYNEAQPSYELGIRSL